MPISQPPISDDIVQSSWQYEVTSQFNELELRSGRVSRGPIFPTSVELGAEHYLTEDITDFTKGWYKFDIIDSWIKIS